MSNVRNSVERALHDFKESGECKVRDAQLFEMIKSHLDEGGIPYDTDLNPMTGIFTFEIKEAEDQDQDFLLKLDEYLCELCDRRVFVDSSDDVEKDPKYCPYCKDGGGIVYMNTIKIDKTEGK